MSKAQTSNENLYIQPNLILSLDVQCMPKLSTCSNQLVMLRSSIWHKNTKWGRFMLLYTVPLVLNHVYLNLRMRSEPRDRPRAERSAVIPCDMMQGRATQLQPPPSTPKLSIYPAEWQGAGWWLLHFLIKLFHFYPSSCLASAQTFQTGSPALVSCQTYMPCLFV